MALTVRYKSLSVVKGATQDGLAGCQLEVRLFADGAAATTKLGGAGGTGWKAFTAGEADLGNAEREYASEAENLEFRVFCRRSGTEEKAHVLVASTARAQLLKVRVLQALDLHVPGDTKSIAGTLTIKVTAAAAAASAPPTPSPAKLPAEPVGGTPGAGASSTTPARATAAAPAATAAADPGDLGALSEEQLRKLLQEETRKARAAKAECEAAERTLAATKQEVVQRKEALKAVNERLASSAAPVDGAAKARGGSAIAGVKPGRAQKELEGIMRDLQETHAKIAAVMDERDAISRTFGVKSRPRSATTHHGYGPDWHPVKGEIPPRLTSLEAKLEMGWKH